MLQSLTKYDIGNEYTHNYYIQRITKEEIYSLQYIINAFLNAEGGNILVGVNKNQIITGTNMTFQNRQELIGALDLFCSYYSPQILPTDVEIKIQMVEDHIIQTIVQKQKTQEQQRSEMIQNKKLLQNQQQQQEQEQQQAEQIIKEMNNKKNKKNSYIHNKSQVKAKNKDQIESANESFSRADNRRRSSLQISQYDNQVVYQVNQDNNSEKKLKKHQSQGTIKQIQKLTKYIIHITVRPRIDCKVTYINQIMRQAYITNSANCTLIKLRSIDIVNRLCKIQERSQQLAQERCQQLYDNQQKIFKNIQNFVSDNKQKNTTKIIILEGSYCSGKSFLANFIYQNLPFQEKYAIDLQDFVYVNEVYYSLIQQFNEYINMSNDLIKRVKPELLRYNQDIQNNVFDKELQSGEKRHQSKNNKNNLNNDKHNTVQKQENELEDDIFGDLLKMAKNATNKPSSQSEEQNAIQQEVVPDIILQQLFVPEIQLQKRCQILRNILFNEMLDESHQNSLIWFDSVNEVRIDDLINYGCNCTYLIATNNAKGLQLGCQAQSCDIIVEQMDQLSKDQIKQIIVQNAEGIDLSEAEIEQQVRKLEELKYNFNSYFDYFKLYVHSIKNTNNKGNEMNSVSFRLVYSQVQFLLNGLSIIEDSFPLGYMKYLLDIFGTCNLEVVLIHLLESNQVIISKNDMLFSIDQNERQKITLQLNDMEQKKFRYLIVDFVIEQLKSLNQQYMGSLEQKQTDQSDQEELQIACDDANTIHQHRIETLQESEDEFQVVNLKQNSMKTPQKDEQKTICTDDDDSMPLHVQLRCAKARREHMRKMQQKKQQQNINNQKHKNLILQKNRSVLITIDPIQETELHYNVLNEENATSLKYSKQNSYQVLQMRQLALLAKDFAEQYEFVIKSCVNAANDLDYRKQLLYDEFEVFVFFSLKSDIQNIIRALKHVPDEQDKDQTNHFYTM